MRPITAELLAGRDLYKTVVLDRLAHARESVWISTANVKAMLVEQEGKFRPVLDLFAKLAKKGVELRLLHAELPSRPFRAAFDRHASLVRGGLQLKICPRVHFKAVIVDGAWVYLGSANLTGAGLGAKGDGKRNFEVGFVTEDFDVIDRTTALFQSVWSGAECGPCALRKICPDPLGPATPRRRGGEEASPCSWGGGAGCGRRTSPRKLPAAVPPGPSGSTAAAAVPRLEVDRCAMAARVRLSRAPERLRSAFRRRL